MTMTKWDCFKSSPLNIQGSIAIILIFLIPIVAGFMHLEEGGDVIVAMIGLPVDISIIVLLNEMKLIIQDGLNQRKYLQQVGLEDAPFEEQKKSLQRLHDLWDGCGKNAGKYSTSGLYPIFWKKKPNE